MRKTKSIEEDEGVTKKEKEWVKKKVRTCLVWKKEYERKEDERKKRKDRNEKDEKDEKDEKVSREQEDYMREVERKKWMKGEEEQKHNERKKKRKRRDWLDGGR